jgi:NAD(P)-dependent dehydrogenase (short-subunit alcohol dehydrogenase family)
MRFRGKVAFVTGAASGIGLAAARRFAAEGARVVLADIDAAGVRRAADELPDTLAVEVDTASERSVQAAVAAAVAHAGRLDVVFNNAGVEAAQAPLHETSADDWRRVGAVNGDGAFHVLKHGIAALLESGGGAVVNTASAAGLTARENISAYTFTKAGLVGLTRSAALEYAARGIRVNAVAPTIVLTPLVERFIAGSPDPAALRARLDSYTPTPGIPTPEDVAATVAFLASDDARWITGHTIPVDGGHGIR